MSILVTGASGFLGGAVVQRLLAHGERSLRCFIRPTSTTTRLKELQALYPNANLEFVVGNLTSVTDVHRALDGIETVYHLAAKMRGAPATVFLNTVVASKRLLDAARETKPRRVVLVSSLSVYGTSQVPCGSPIDENGELEQHPEKRDVYSHAKLRQELLFHEYEARGEFELVVLRPGSIYGIGGKNFCARVGIEVRQWLLHFGRNNLLPLTYLDNCAEAVTLAGAKSAAGDIYNVIDDDLPTSAEYVKAYRSNVERIRSISVPFFITMTTSRLAERYHVYSQQRVPALLTQYKSASLWRGCRFSNEKLKRMGWLQIVPTGEAMQKTFEYLNHQKANAGDSTLTLCPNHSQVVRGNPCTGVALERGS